MKHIFQILFLILVVEQAFAEGPVYNFNFYNSDGGEKLPTINLDKPALIVGQKVESKKDSYLDRFEFRYSYGGLNGDTNDGADLSIYGSTFSLLIPLKNRWHLTLSYLHSVGGSYYYDDIYYDTLTTNLVMAGFEKEVEIVTNISLRMNIAGFYGKMNVSDGYGYDYDDYSEYNLDDVSYKTYGAVVEIGPKFRIGKTTFGLTLNSSIIKSDLGSAKSNIGGSLFVGYTI